MRQQYTRRLIAGSALAGVCAASAWVGAFGIASGFLPLGEAVSSRLPLHSPIFAAIALGVVVAAPTSVAAMLVWRKHPRAGTAISVAGIVLVGWIGVESFVIRQFSVLQPVCALAGVAMILLGDRRVARQFAEVAAAAPRFVLAPLVRPWHLRWGATPDEVVASMQGDELVRTSHFTATRAITIDAPPEAVWPLPIQIGFGRAASWIDLYWIPLGAGGHVVQLNGRLYEALVAWRQHRSRQQLYHAALEVVDHGRRYSIEMAPAWKDRAPERRVVCEGPVGLRLLGGLRTFRYEVRCWHNGRIPDLAFAVDSPRRISDDPAAVTDLLEMIDDVPPLTWGLDEAHAGEMWNSNSVIAWLLARIGQPAATIHPPAHGRAPGWNAGLTLAGRQGAPALLGSG